MTTSNSISAAPDSLGHAAFDMLRQLSAISESDAFLCRRYLTPEHARANALVGQWMRDAGLEVSVDPLGNLIGRTHGGNTNVPTLSLGSHLDTVRDAGRYDGALGVLLPIACLNACRDAGVKLPFNVEIIGFGDEEGVRFGSTLIGSKGMAGNLDASVLDVNDVDGTSLGEALEAFGLPKANALRAKRLPEDVSAFLEVHIEQGPVLESENLAVGVVTAIAGASRYAIEVAGLAGHAGTVPMSLRQDALTGAAEMVLAAETLANEHDDLVATAGKLEVANGAVNVIPGSVTFTIDVRSGVDQIREEAIEALRSKFEDIATRRGIQAGWSKLHENSAATCDAALSEQLANAISATGRPVRHLPSGAGHDAMAMAELAPAAMLFVRCEGGISHHPDEDMTVEDAQAAGEVLWTFLQTFDVQSLNADGAN